MPGVVYCKVFFFALQTIYALLYTTNRALVFENLWPVLESLSHTHSLTLSLSLARERERALFLSHTHKHTNELSPTHTTDQGVDNFAGDARHELALLRNRQEKKNKTVHKCAIV